MAFLVTGAVVIARARVIALVVAMLFVSARRPRRKGRSALSLRDLIL